MAMTAIFKWPDSDRFIKLKKEKTPVLLRPYVLCHIATVIITAGPVRGR
jgi:hypothetical protein